jgi:formate dehydrogenase iron-sulfur subunit
MIAILVDVTRCAGCYQCVQACVQANQLGEATLQPQDVGDGLSAERWTTLVEGPFDRQVRKFCQHCLEPACVSVCPVGAMYKTPEGPVLYDAAKCMGCRYCMMACPFGIPRYEWDSAAPLVQKCIFCYPLLQQGQLPACVSACPHEALAFGQREEMLALARQRQAGFPGKYLDTIFGEHEVGGTSVLYLSDISLEGLLSCGEASLQPMPELTWNWISKVPGVGLGMGVITGLLWIIERRMSAEKAQAAKHGGGETDADH